ncbi:hypothetical protein PanWU01x14_017540 [Parasponia andersonii]|uniref:Uncharacterized protein n=1 Tax=Parasponia andersonii TaxID=3476 RepID=A0A2P5DZY1_PARAD|nr:hypothetical protein PanWU01x14_017540 [Parasponia andersonii]
MSFFDLGRFELFNGIVNRLVGRFSHTVRILGNDLLELFDSLLEVFLGEPLFAQVLKHLLLFCKEVRLLFLPSLLRVLECLSYFIELLSFL